VRVIVGGVGYRNLRDHSVGLAVTDLLALRGLAPGGEAAAEVVVEDLSYNPLAVGWRLDDEPPAERVARIVLVAGVARGTRVPGSIVAYRWDRVLPPPDEVQRAVTEAVTGIISVDNTLIMLAHFGALPPEAIVVEVEPLVHEFGEAFSAPVAARFEELCALVMTLATDAGAASTLPRASLGGALPAAAAEA
jgi:hypothetical protein